MRKYIDETIARELQRKYEEGDQRSLTMLYCELRRMAGLILGDMKVSSSMLDQFSHDAASNLVSQYLKHPGYRVHTSFSAILRRYCLGAANERELNPSHDPNRPIVRARRMTVPIDEARDEKSKIENDDLQDDVLLTAFIKSYFAHFKRFSIAVRALSSYVDKQWLLYHAKPLKRLYDETRGNGKGTM